MYTTLSIAFHNLTQATFVKFWSPKPQLISTDKKVNAIGSLLGGERHSATTSPEYHGTFSLIRFFWFSSLIFGVYSQRTDLFPSQFELSKLDGTNGFIINGENGGDHSGWSVSQAGDVNGDGLSDLVIGARYADPSGRSKAGKSYVVFGSLSPVSGGILELSSLNGTNGFILIGETAGDNSGWSVSSAGDVNGDGLSDLVIGARDAYLSNKTDVGKSYVVFGSRSFASSGILELSSLNGQNGFVLNGENAGDNSGYSVDSANDLNGDGLFDIVIGARYADPSRNTKAGKSYVVFGSKKLVSGGTLELSSLNGTYGFILNGEADYDRSGTSVSSTGDLNGDGLSDLVIGAPLADPLGRSSAGKSYVVFGSRIPIMGGTLELSNLNGTNGFTLIGETTGDNSGWSVSTAGDWNGDGISDLVIGAFGASPSGRTGAGKSYVVFGSKKLVSGGILELSSLNGTNGFILNGEVNGDLSGWSVSSAGDLNGDGLTDLVIGANSAAPSGRTLAGKSYVVYGSRNFVKGGTLELSSLNGQNGFIINGEASDDHSGISVSSAGDLNGDGHSDLVIGAYLAEPSGRFDTGKCYVIYGRNLTQSTLPPSLSMATLSSQKASKPSSLTKTPISSYAQTITDQRRAYFSPTAELLTNNVDDSSSQLPADQSSQPLVSPSTSTLILPQTSVNDSTPLIAGIAAAVTALACSLLAGGTFYYRKRSTKSKDTGEVQLENHDPLDGYVSNTAIQREKESVSVSNMPHEYGQIPPSADYVKAPQPAHLYDQVIMEDHNNNTYQVVEESLREQENVYDSPSSPL